MYIMHTTWYAYQWVTFKASKLAVFFLSEIPAIDRIHLQTEPRAIALVPAANSRSLDSWIGEASHAKARADELTNSPSREARRAALLARADEHV